MLSTAVLYEMSTRVTVFYQMTYHERDQSSPPVFLYGLFQSVSSQGQLLICGQKPDLDQSDQTCLLNWGMSLEKQTSNHFLWLFHLIYHKLFRKEHQHWPDLKRRQPVVNLGPTRPYPGWAQPSAAVFCLSWLPAERPVCFHWQCSTRRDREKGKQIQPSYHRDNDNGVWNK